MKFTAPIDLKEYMWFVEELQKRRLIKKPIYPDVLMSLSKQRDIIKKEMHKYQKDSPEFMSFNIRQASVKLIMVASYGVAGHAPQKGKAVRFFDEDFFNSVTGTDQDIIKETVLICEECGFTVLYGDTDSTFLKPKIPIDTFKLTLWADIIAKKINYLIKQRFQELLPISDEDWYIILEPKNVYDSIIFTSAKKKYRGEVVWTENEYHKETDLVGFEAKRSDAFPLMVKVQEDCQKILIESPLENIEQNILCYMGHVEEDLFNGKFDGLLAQEKTIRKTALEDYEHSDPHVEAAQQLLNKGALRMGDRVSWIVKEVKKGKQIIAAIDPRDNKASKPSPTGYRYYMNRLWDMIERLLGKSMSTITEHKLDKWMEDGEEN